MYKHPKPNAFFHRLSPQTSMALTFMAAIAIGAALLMLPSASTNGQSMHPVRAIFTATSATCVTGLSVMDIGTELTLFGQLVVLTLIQLGGLGITTIGTFLLVLVGRRLSLQNEFVLMDAYGAEEVYGLRTLLTSTMAFTLLFEGLGALVLWAHYHAIGFGSTIAGGLWKELYYAVFHSISAFCNAGFSLHADNLAGFQKDPVYLYTICTLIVFGGLGFLVLHNLITIKFWQRNRKTRGRISLHAKIVLSSTAVLIVVGTAMILIQEWHHALKALPMAHKINCAIFHAITPRTAGFNVLPMEQLTEGSRYVTCLLMLVGGSPGSSAGGIKTTTMVVLVMTIYAMCKSRRETLIFSRTVTHTTVREALVIFLLAVALILLSYGILLWTEFPQKADDASKLMFETISATATVGLSINHTPTLSIPGQWVIIVCMFLGRLGPIAIALLIANEEDTLRIRYPEEEVVVG